MVSYQKDCTSELTQEDISMVAKEAVQDFFYCDMRGEIEELVKEALEEMRNGLAEDRHQECRRTGIAITEVIITHNYGLLLVFIILAALGLTILYKVW